MYVKYVWRVGRREGFGLISWKHKGIEVPENIKWRATFPLCREKLKFSKEL
jgi:hypothetical protein